MKTKNWKNCVQNPFKHRACTHKTERWWLVVLVVLLWVYVYVFLSGAVTTKKQTNRLSLHKQRTTIFPYCCKSTNISKSTPTHTYTNIHKHTYNQTKKKNTSTCWSKEFFCFCFFFNQDEKNQKDFSSRKTNTVLPKRKTQQHQNNKNQQKHSKEIPDQLHKPKDGETNKEKTRTNQNIQTKRKSHKDPPLIPCTKWLN